MTLICNCIECMRPASLTITQLRKGVAGAVPIRISNLKDNPEIIFIKRDLKYASQEQNKGYKD